MKTLIVVKSNVITLDRHHNGAAATNKKDMCFHSRVHFARKTPRYRVLSPWIEGQGTKVNKEKSYTASATSMLFVRLQK